MRTQMKIVSTSIAAVLCVHSFLPFTASAWASSYELHYTGYEQLTDVWCWAACAETSAKHEVPDSDYNQTYAAYFIFGMDDAEHMGTMADTEAAAEYIAENTIDYAHGSYSTIVESHIGEIVANHVEIIGRMHSSGAGHMVTMKAFYFAEDGSRYMRYFDPWNGREITCPYTGFVDGSYDGYFANESCSFRTYF